MLILVALRCTAKHESQYRTATKTATKIVTDDRRFRIREAGMAAATGGVFQHPAGSGVWWVNFYFAGKRHREKVGRRSDAIALYQKRKTEGRSGLKLPETLRVKKAVLFEDLAKDAMLYSAAHKRSHRGDLCNLNSLLPVFGKMKADEIAPCRDRFVSGYQSRSKARNAQSLSLNNVDDLCGGDS
jgi:hypothetical protein